uniref:Uncharacterized protein n=1 Tax=Sinocyclocheilus rhinocerous TaxID=307959 RepID=A0A673HT93_9TELE
MYVCVLERVAYWCILFKFSMTLCIRVSMVSHKLSTHSTSTHPHITQNTLTHLHICEEHLNAGSSWSLCKSFIQNADNTPEGNRASTATEHLDTQHFMKRYGGFMKRYGEFMKKTAELYGLEPEDVDQGRVILTNHDVEMLTNQVEADGGREEEVLTDVHDSKGGAQGVKGMAKRYGGFMKRGQRVGRPQWWQESKRYGGFLKRSQKEDEDEN